jgi:phosphoribosylanthranilate isomerase
VFGVYPDLEKSGEKRIEITVSMGTRIKVCGMKYRENLRSLVGLHPDFVGFIFYSKSKRFVGKDFQPELLKEIPEEIKTVGVFVNENLEALIRLQEKFHFDYLQLHGDESPELCKKLKENNCKIIKAFSVDASFDFSSLKPYASVCDYFLFDTKGESYGGNGTRFEWSILKNYDFTVPFFLSGGISPEHAEEIAGFEHPQFFSVDINSKFEDEPGLKNISKLKGFFENLHVLEK